MARNTKQQIAHLLRRAGFGASAADLDYYTSLGFEGAVDHLINYSRVDDSEAEQVVATMRAENPDPSNPNHPEYGNPGLEMAVWLARMTKTKRPLQEKMTLFWHGLLTSNIRDVKVAGLMANQNALYRSMALPVSYRDMMKAVARDPAMLIYLDNNTNVKGKPNENWAREMMELFTLGIGNYTETDVKEAARAFTGWSVERGTGQFVFNANKHDNDSKTFLGTTGNLNGDDIIDIVFQQPAQSKFIAKRLFRFFVYDTPDDATVARFADIYLKSGFNVRELVTQLLLSPEFRSDKAFFSLVKSPIEFTIGALRALSANVTLLKTWQGLNNQMASMGQQVYNPPNVGGWFGNTSWLGTTAMFTRMETARQLVSIENDTTIDPMEIASANALTTPTQAVDYFLDLLIQGDAPEDYKQSLISFVGSFTDDKDKNGKLRGLVRLVMATPVYQMN
ncbi:MAG: DUF1800 domain-containing protein [Chloroflexia bacterium]